MAEERIRIEVERSGGPKRLDKFLAEHLSGRFSRSFLQKLIASGNVLVDGRAAKSHHILRGGEAIDVTVPEARLAAARPENIPIDIVYEDEHLLVVNKAAEMVVHPAPGNYSGTLVNALLFRSGELSGVGGETRPGVVHRIDKGTSGLLVVAKNDAAHRSLAKQFKDKTIKRVYVALVKGSVELDNGIIELPIGRHVRDRKKMAVKFEDSKEALTRYRVSERFKDFTVLELVLGTGRTHQIRVHMSYIGHPLIGDAAYGSRSAIGRPALHAKTIGFMHPVTKRYMEFTSELPADMKEIIAKGTL